MIDDEHDFNANNLKYSIFYIDEFSEHKKTHKSFTYMSESSSEIDCRLEILHKCDWRRGAKFSFSLLLSPEKKLVIYSCEQVASAREMWHQISSVDVDKACRLKSSVEISFATQSGNYELKLYVNLTLTCRHLHPCRCCCRVRRSSLACYRQSRAPARSRIRRISFCWARPSAALDPLSARSSGWHNLG